MRYAAQLYTLREFTNTEDGFATALGRLQAMGYEGVQLSAVGCMNGETPAVDAKRARFLLDEHGLVAAATHRSFDALENETQKEIEFHQILGCNYTAIGMAPSETFDAGYEGFVAFAKRLNAVAEKLSKAEISFGYHNHHTEWRRDEKGTFMEALITGASERLQFEIDTYWVVHAGVDLEELIGRLAGKLDVVHFKDKEVVGWETRFSPVGYGNLNWAKYLPALEAAGTKWAAVEQDECYGQDPFECLEKSIRWLHALR